MTVNSAERFGELQALLAAAGALCDAAEAHGTLCGLICTHGAGAGELWVAELLPAPPAGDVLSGERRRQLLEMADRDVRDFEDAAFPFQPLLPGDDEPVSRRADALGHWAQGFLHGLAVSRRPESLRARLQAEPLAELVQDLGEITRAAGSEDGDAETDESAYTEVVEYLRVAAQLFYLELASLRADHHAAPGRLQ